MKPRQLTPTQIDLLKDKPAMTLRDAMARARVAAMRHATTIIQDIETGLVTEINLRTLEDFDFEIEEPDRQVRIAIYI